MAVQVVLLTAITVGLLPLAIDCEADKQLFALPCLLLTCWHLYPVTELFTLRVRDHAVTHLYHCVLLLLYRGALSKTKGSLHCKKPYSNVTLQRLYTARCVQIYIKCLVPCKQNDHMKSLDICYIQFNIL